MTKKEWFAEWFDTPYYHMLYRHRDEEEATQFIARLLDYLKLPQGSKVLDLACGKGRHSRTLHQLGMDVVGLDLSNQSIHDARKYATAGLHFDVHDMREVYAKKQFDVVFNLFTSFGYFEEMDANQQVLKSIHQMLNPNGQLIIDFMNAQRAIDHLQPSEVKNIDGVPFNITRRYDGSHIYKEIQFEAEQQHFQFTERVQALRLNDFTQLLTSTGFQIIRTFGDFSLHPFEEKNADRLIIHAKRI